MKTPLKLSLEKESLVSRYEHSIGVIVGLSNDYFSWEMERNQDRICNSVLVVVVDCSRAAGKYDAEESHHERGEEDIGAKIGTREFHEFVNS